MRRSASSAPFRHTAHGLARRDWAPSAQFVEQLRAASVPACGLFLGMGFAGAVLDGLIVQQLLGWHPLSAEPEAAGRRATSLYFVATLAVLLFGLDLLFRLPPQVRQRSRRVTAGWGLLGAGLFVLLVGLGDHHLAAVRHLLPDSANVVLWDLAYLALGVAFLSAGALVLNRRRSRAFWLASAVPAQTAAEAEAVAEDGSGGSSSTRTRATPSFLKPSRRAAASDRSITRSST